MTTDINKLRAAINALMRQESGAGNGGIHSIHNACMYREKCKRQDIKFAEMEKGSD